jgi:signal transduction histidine kinase/HAMP domain-containing protein
MIDQLLSLNLGKKILLPQIVLVLGGLGLLIGAAFSFAGFHDQMHERLQTERAKYQVTANLQERLIRLHAESYRLIGLQRFGLEAHQLADVGHSIFKDAHGLTRMIANLQGNDAWTESELEAAHRLRIGFEDYVAALNEVIEATMSGVPIAAIFMVGIEQSFDAAYHRIEELHAVQSRASFGDLEASLVRASVIMLALFLSCVIVGTGLAILVSRSITRPIERVTDVMNRIAAGDLEAPLPGATRTDEIGTMVTALHVFRENAIQLAAFRSRLVEALETIPAGMVLFDRADQLVMCNSRYRKIYGQLVPWLSPGVVLDAILDAALASGDFRLQGVDEAATKAQYLALLRAPESAFEVQAPDGRWFQVLARRTDRGDGVSVWIDVTETKEREDQMIAARNAAEAANAAKSSFLANMSHELRTPLNAIIGFSEIMVTELFGSLGHDRYKGYAIDINTSGQHLRQVINDILDFSKLDSGTLDLSEAPVVVEEVIAAAKLFVLTMAQKGGVQVLTSLPREPIVMLADELRLKQALINLLSNAVKFTPPGGVVTVSALVENNGVCIEVRDTGIGIAPGDLNEVIKPFRQVDSSLARAHDGTGLGLPLAKRLIELHGGELTLESELGAGTVVSVTLPQSRLICRLPQYAN